MIVTVKTIAAPDPLVGECLRPDLPRDVNVIVRGPMGTTVPVAISDADAEREDVQAAIARAAQ